MKLFMPETWSNYSGYNDGVPTDWTKHISQNGVLGYQGMYNELAL